MEAGRRGERAKKTERGEGKNKQGHGGVTEGRQPRDRRTLSYGDMNLRVLFALSICSRGLARGLDVRANFGEFTTEQLWCVEQTDPRAGVLTALPAAS